jgi:hypothetical protein
VIWKERNAVDYDALSNHRPDPRIDQVREALGAVAAASPAVFWLYCDGNGRWCVRREGALQEQQFTSRQAAGSFMRVEAARCSSCRLFILGTDGRVEEEAHNWPNFAAGNRVPNAAGY